MRPFVRCALSVAVLLLVWCALFAAPVVSPSRIDRVARLIDDAAADGPRVRHAQPDAAEGALDLYGNEVDDAIATYSLDPAGSPYEVHSPQTELPRLGPPKS